jgi:hypothetical protein
MGSAEVHDFRGRKYVWSTAGQSFDLMCGMYEVMKFMWIVMGLLYLTASIQHFTAHNTSALVCSVTVLDIAVTLTERMKYMARKWWHFSVTATFITNLRLCKILNFSCNFSKHQTPYSWRPSYVVIFQNFCT